MHYHVNKVCKIISCLSLPLGVKSISLLSNRSDVLVEDPVGVGEGLASMIVDLDGKGDVSRTKGADVVSSEVVMDGLAMVVIVGGAGADVVLSKGET